MNWKADKYLIRVCEPGSYNLALGEPILLQKGLSYLYHEAFENCSELGAGYPQTTPTPTLRLELERRYPGKRVVVTCGAKQALHAVAYALKAQGKTHLGIQPPFWPTFPTIAGFAGLRLLRLKNRVPGGGKPSSAVANFWVCNNNPDGDSGFNLGIQYDVVDAAYASGLYGWSGFFPQHTTSVWSASKLLGLSGVRVGWVVTDDPEIATLVAQYVEQTTSGVATTSQEMVGILLNRMNYRESQQALEDVREHMVINGRTFNEFMRSEEVV
jgi:aspartate/methionine/tyrosine aminotransferase